MEGVETTKCKMKLHIAAFKWLQGAAGVCDPMSHGEPGRTFLLTTPVGNCTELLSTGSCSLPVAQQPHCSSAYLLEFFGSSLFSNYDFLLTNSVLEHEQKTKQRVQMGTAAERGRVKLKCVTVPKENALHFLNSWIFAILRQPVWK